jgi:DNA-binding transcriptional ArsR family regulator
LGKILASVGRQKILRVLSKTKDIKITSLIRLTNGTYNEVMRNIRILEGEGIVIYKRLNRKCIISLDTNSKKTKTLLKALNILDAGADSELSFYGAKSQSQVFEEYIFAA